MTGTLLSRRGLEWLCFDMWMRDRGGFGRCVLVLTTSFERGFGSCSLLCWQRVVCCIRDGLCLCEGFLSVSQSLVSRYMWGRVPPLNLTHNAIRGDYGEVKPQWWKRYGNPENFH